jgi:hypothetical protein
MNTTDYFKILTPINHPEAISYLPYVEKALTAYIDEQPGKKGRTLRWVYVPEEDKYLRVIIEPDGKTIHNAHWDRSFKRRVKRK